MPTQEAAKTWTFGELIYLNELAGRGLQWDEVARRLEHPAEDCRQTAARLKDHGLGDTDFGKVDQLDILSALSASRHDVVLAHLRLLCAEVEGVAGQVEGIVAMLMAASESARIPGRVLVETIVRRCGYNTAERLADMTAGVCRDAAKAGAAPDDPPKPPPPPENISGTIT